MIREKKRYLQLKINAPTQLDEEHAKHLIYAAVFEALGEHGASKAGVQLKKFDFATQTAVVRCSNSLIEQAIAALALKRRQDGKDVSIRLLKISGMIGKLG
ncbi:TPA: hypothetical protein HA318_01085 [Candidatus Micrarchaeota archaeon]|nr:MAG: hypothetical protein AUJ65_01865 [Candidatus Micrarchaeota archaeon CG1_02_51_15]HII38581.1 hypothetical protein [Candidatus Micrarchaeota archaeon]